VIFTLYHSFSPRFLGLSQRVRLLVNDRRGYTLLAVYGGTGSGHRWLVGQEAAVSETILVVFPAHLGIFGAFLLAV